MWRVRSYELGMSLLAGALALAVSSCSTATDSSSNASIEPSADDVSVDMASIIDVGTNCSSRMRRVADILDERIALLKKGEELFPRSQATVVRERIELKDHILRNEERALRIGDASLVILWKDEYGGKVLEDKDVHTKYLEGTLPRRSDR